MRSALPDFAARVLPVVAACAGRDARQAGFNRGDWWAIQRAARAQNVESLLYAALAATGQLRVAPFELQTALAQSYWRTRTATLLAVGQLEFALAALASADIRPVVLKGAALALTLYQDPGWRRLGDIDLLVHTEDVAQSDAIFQRQGFSALPDVHEGFSAGYRNECTFWRNTAPAVQLDLHWELSARTYLRRHMPMAWFWSHTAPMQHGMPPGLVLNPEAQLLHLCAHAFQHGAPAIRWTYDIALLLSRWSIDWAEVLAAAVDFGLALPLKSTLHAACDRWGVALPGAVNEELMRLPVDWRQRALQRFGVASNASGLMVVDALCEPDVRKTLRLWWSVAFPSPTYMRRRYRLPDNRALLASYVRRVYTGSQHLLQMAGQALNRE